jgi:hypothetical protein
MREQEGDAGPGARDAEPLRPPRGGAKGASDEDGASRVPPPPPASDEEAPVPPPPPSGPPLPPFDNDDEDGGQFYTLDDALDRCGKAGWFQLGMLGFTGLSW